MNTRFFTVSAAVPFLFGASIAQAHHYVETTATNISLRQNYGGEFQVSSTSITHASLLANTPIQKGFVPKTDRGRKILELRRLAMEAGETFVDPQALISEFRKNRYEPTEG